VGAEAAHLVVVRGGEKAQGGPGDEQDDEVLEGDTWLPELLPGGPASRRFLDQS
jgi:hypothetical protein